MKFLVLTTLLVIATLTLACASDDSDVPTPTPSLEPTLLPPQPIPRITSSIMDPSAFVSPSIDQQILDSDIIVVASFVTASPGVQTIPGDSGVAPTYRPTQILSFQANQYLKGTGPNEFRVEVLDDSYGVDVNGNLYRGYLTEAEAMEAATELIAQRNTSYDNRPGVLFLKGVISSETPSGSKTETVASSFAFVLSNQGAQSNFQYAIDTLSRTWLPAKETITAEVGGSSDTEYITDGSKEPPPVLPLTYLETRIEEIDSLLQKGEEIDGYADCVYGNLIRERWFRADPDSRVREIDVTIDSGLAAKSVSLEKEWGDPYFDAVLYHDDYHEFWYSGSDAEHFTAVIEDMDSIASNGHIYFYSTARPLAKGQYNVNFHLWPASDALCMPKPTNEAEDYGYSNWTVTVTAPGGTLHEAFFDPVESGEDEVSPASFSVGGTDTEITGLEWADGKVVLSLDPVVSLDGYTLDFIELDGTASLNLRTSDAVERSRSGDGSGALKWSVADEPWEDGDKLMLRIREDGAAAPPTPEPGG